MACDVFFNPLVHQKSKRVVTSFNSTHPFPVSFPKTRKEVTSSLYPYYLWFFLEFLNGKLKARTHIHTIPREEDTYFHSHSAHAAFNSLQSSLQALTNHISLARSTTTREREERPWPPSNMLPLYPKSSICNLAESRFLKGRLPHSSEPLVNFYDVLFHFIKEIG